MIPPLEPENEAHRIKALHNLAILDSHPEQEYDELTKLAAYICQTPVSLISLIGEEQNWFKSKVGTEISGSPREYSHCAHAILEPDMVMEIEDTRKDVRFADNPFTLAAEPVIFYSGVPLLNKKGLALGTLCVIDNIPRKLNDEQKNALKTLAKQVSLLFELRERNQYLKKVQTGLKERNGLLKNFAAAVSHDMKMPLANIILTIDILKSKYGKKLDKKGEEYLQNLKQVSFALSDYISAILDHYESDTIASESNHEKFHIHDLLEGILDLLNITENAQINFPESNLELLCNKIALEQIFLNLINNSLKYNDKNEIIIDITCSEDPVFYQFEITDNGIGIPPEKQEEIFELFSTAAEADRKGKKGNGIGLSTVKKLVLNLGGDIEVSSEVGKGARFTFKVKKILSGEPN
ncbi:MAG TPA: GAF domain-containing sensor histidine kinase [Salinimicrobium sp.]|nr:GAF domain-containing sensor histidine kinase [Salinimicrobium sp.]